ncbi:thioredoxin family protein [Segetibacter koreensis]|uniref:thioredoxin family protein n=1 Tax=Segetibacter koreensis TaxID=398037 RepID=UPI000378D976|nr:thioredoxin family protein [Segetibacter koreensis]
MSYLSVLLLLLMTHSTWMTDFEKGKSEAVASKKLIVLNFSGSDWCGPCIRLKREIFESDAFENFSSDKLVLVNADFPRYKKNELSKEQVKENEALAEKYNSSGKFPFTVLLDADGKVLKQWDGFPNETPEKFVDEIKTFEHAGN